MRVASTRMAPALGIVLALALLSGCGEETSKTDAPGVEKTTEAPRLAGKADGGLKVLEAGRFGYGTHEAQGTFKENAMDGYRVQAFKGSQMRFELVSTDGNTDPFLIVEGPLPSREGKIVAFNDDASKEDFNSGFEVTFEEAGVYRVLATNYSTLFLDEGAEGSYQISATCEKNCEMPQITLAEMLQDLQGSLGDAGVRQLVEGGLAGLFPDPETAEGVRAQVDALLSGGLQTEAFPVLPLSVASTAQGLFERPGEPLPDPGTVTFKLDDLVKEACNPARSGMSPVSENIPGLMSGSFADYTVDECNLQRAQDLANVLNNLALENGSSVVNGDDSYHSVKEVFGALLDSGHFVRVENQRFYADFLGLYYKGAAVVAPVWLDTGIEVPDSDDTLKIPAPHTHHTITIEGPLMNARLMYYMGISGGVSWRAVDTVRSPWSGVRTSYTYESTTDADKIIEMMAVGGELRKKWFREGKDLPKQGYGILGVCNDSTAVMEYSAEGTVSVFPLAHSSDGEGDDLISGILREIPSDVTDFDKEDALKRIQSTLPSFPAQRDPFPVLTSTMAKFAKDAEQ